MGLDVEGFPWHDGSRNGRRLCLPPAGIGAKVLAAIGGEGAIGDQVLEQLAALIGIEVEQARSLGDREAKAGHLAILPSDTVLKIVGHGGGISNRRAERLASDPARVPRRTL